MTAIKTIGILGAGQLGRMIAIAAAQMGIRAHIFSPDAKDSPAAEVAQTFTQADYEDTDALAAFGRSIDVVTSEFENVPATTMYVLAAFCPVSHQGMTLFIWPRTVYVKKHWLRTLAYRHLHSGSHGQQMI